MDEFSSDFESFSEHRLVGTAQVAKALGVSVTSVKRWVDEGILPARKTAGGHRKLLMSDVVRLAREGDLPHVDLSHLFPKPQKVDLSNPQAIREQLAQAIRQQDGTLVHAIIHGAYHRGYPVETLADRVISPVMNEVGHHWESGEIDVMQEHRATQAIVASLYELRSVLRTQASSIGRPIAIGGAPEHDHYILPSLLCKLVLLDLGWNAIHLGPHTPISAFISAIDELNPQLIWISVTHLADPESFVESYIELYRRAEARGIAIALGGRSLTDTLRSRLPYTTFGDGLTHLAAFARTLHRLPMPPRRGRPPIQKDE